LLPLEGAQAISSVSDLLGHVYLGCLAILLLTLAIFVGYFGIGLLGLLNLIWEQTKHEHFQLYLKQVTIGLFIAEGTVLVIVALLILYIILDADRHPVEWIIINYIVRILEFTAILGLLIITGKRKPTPQRKFSEEGFLSGKENKRSSLNG